MDSFGNRNRDLATALTALVATDHPVISEVTPLLENFVENVPLADADINVVVREGWFQLLCRGTTVLRLAHTQRHSHNDGNHTCHLHIDASFGCAPRPNRQ